MQCLLFVQLICTHICSSKHSLQTMFSSHTHTHRYMQAHTHSLCWLQPTEISQINTYYWQKIIQLGIFFQRTELSSQRPQTWLVCWSHKMDSLQTGKQQKEVVILTLFHGYIVKHTLTVFSTVTKHKASDKQVFILLLKSQNKMVKRTQRHLVPGWSSVRIEKIVNHN